MKYITPEDMAYIRQRIAEVSPGASSIERDASILAIARVFNDLRASASHPGRGKKRRKHRRALAPHFALDRSLMVEAQEIALRTWHKGA